MAEGPKSGRGLGEPFNIQPDGREAIQLSATLWLGATAFVGAGAIITGNIRGLGEFVALATGLMTAVGVAYALFLVLKLCAGRPKWMAFLILPFAVAVAAVAQALLDYGFFHLVKAVFPATRLPDVGPLEWFLVCFANGCLYCANLALLWVTSANRAMRMQAARLARAEADGLRAELNALRLKLNPHFMFNALSSAGGLVDTDRKAEGREMLDRLSNFLRSSFDVGTGDISLDEELSILGDYLEVERVRFPERLRVRMEIHAGAEAALVPSLLLQPLVENAVKYAVAPAMAPVEILIEARLLDDGRLRLVVQNSGPAPARPVSSGTGVGQAATRSRLAIRYGQDARFTAGPTADGYRVQIDLPFEDQAAPNTMSDTTAFSAA
ncbi:histidine kinase [Brevundimonas sp.]|uniref:sensor histidine kinase n=1 Tax=Brevundimonas sp. TaxID=1871086 RepID=UPI0025BB2EC8|nr:histidine kinase [Brevundimonas sp.]